MDESSLSHTRWDCKYHVVFAPKFRRKEIYGKLREDIGKILRQLCDHKGDAFFCFPVILQVFFDKFFLFKPTKSSL